MRHTHKPYTRAGISSVTVIAVTPKEYSVLTNWFKCQHQELFMGTLKFPVIAFGCFMLSVLVSYIHLFSVCLAGGPCQCWSMCFTRRVPWSHAHPRWGEQVMNVVLCLFSWRSKLIQAIAVISIGEWKVAKYKCSHSVKRKSLSLFLKLVFN